MEVTIRKSFQRFKQPTFIVSIYRSIEMKLVIGELFTEDFTEIKDAISNTKIISDDKKIELIEVVACMISIRDRYNIRELNTHTGNT